MINECIKWRNPVMLVCITGFRRINLMKKVEVGKSGLRGLPGYAAALVCAAVFPDIIS